MQENVDTLENTSTQAPASTTAPVLNIPAPSSPVQQPNSVTPKEKNPVKSELDKAGDVSLSVPSTNEIKPLVEVKDTNNDGIPESKATELINDKALEQVTNVKKQKFKIKVNFGKKTIPFMLALILIVVAFIAGISMGSTLFSTTIYNNSYNASANSATSARVVDGKNNVTVAGGFKYTIPETYYYDKYDKGVLIYDENNTFRIYIRGQEGIYDDIANAKTSVKETMIAAGLSVSSIKELSVNKHAYIVAETLDNLTNRMIAFTSATDAYIFYIEIVTSDNNYSMDALNLADDIVTNASLNAELTSMESTDINDIASLIIAASENYKSLNN